MSLRTCSRWSERGRCDGPCADEAAAAASSTRAIVDRAIRGKPCAFCGKSIERTAFLDHHAAFLLADRTTVEWPDVAPELLRETIASRAPVCWDCHIAETFRRRFPELVTDRPGTAPEPRRPGEFPRPRRFSRARRSRRLPRIRRISKKTLRW